MVGLVQVCLKRQDGSSMWCTMRATLFLRPVNMKEDEKGADPENGSDNDDASDASGNGDANGNFQNIPEVILSFRPLEKEPVVFIKQVGTSR